ncbi:MAG: hypothetical protein ACRDYE_04830 [Acidimicrobiales bacterium]
MIVADPGRIDRRSTFVRSASVVLVAILVLGATAVTIRLVVDLIRGGPETSSPAQLLRVGVLTWPYMVISFAFLYWELDGGGRRPGPGWPPSIPIWPFPSTSTREWRDRAGGRNSSTTCTSP